jgi:hypothetical protein
LFIAIVCNFQQTSSLGGVISIILLHQYYYVMSKILHQKYITHPYNL